MQIVRIFATLLRWEKRPAILQSRNNEFVCPQVFRITKRGAMQLDYLARYHRFPFQIFDIEELDFPFFHSLYCLFIFSHWPLFDWLNNKGKLPTMNFTVWANSCIERFINEKLPLGVVTQNRRRHTYVFWVKDCGLFPVYTIIKCLSLWTLPETKKWRLITRPNKGWFVIKRPKMWTLCVAAQGN